MLCKYCRILCKKKPLKKIIINFIQNLIRAEKNWAKTIQFFGCSDKILDKKEKNFIYFLKAIFLNKGFKSKKDQCYSILDKHFGHCPVS